MSKTQSRLGVTVVGISDHVAVIVNDGDTVNFTASGTDNQTITAEIVIDPAVDNITVATVDGVYTKLIDEVTYAELSALISGSGLIQGRQYLITDYQTVHTIPTTAVTNIGPTEHLIVTAIDIDELAPIAYSTLYPDDIIYYNPTNNLTAVPGCTKGYIYRRIDTINNNDIPTDWRHVKYRRYALGVTAVYDVGTSYSSGAIVTDGITDVIYISLGSGNIGNALTDETKWITSSTLINAEYISPTLTTFIVGNLSFPVDNADFQDYTLFAGSGTVINNVIKTNTTNLLALNTVVRNYITGGAYSIVDNNIRIGSSNIITQMVSLKDVFISGSTISDTQSVSSGTINASAIKSIKHCKIQLYLDRVISENTIEHCVFNNSFSIVLIGELSSPTITFKNNIFNNVFESASVLGSFQNNTINCYTSGGNLTAATHIYADYNTEIFFKVGSGTPRLRYTDNTDTIIYSAITA